MTDVVPIRDAATMIVLRNRATRPAVLMGQRGKTAAFMPGKFVFPGGAVDPNDAQVPCHPMSSLCIQRLMDRSNVSPTAIATAAIRELWEETGQVLGASGDWRDPPQGWRGFAQTGHVPNGAALQFFFRAVTPIGSPRRFDARFLLADAADLTTNIDDFSGAEDELSHLQWVPLQDARDFDLPFITQVVLAELISHMAHDGPPRTVPFFANDDERHLVHRLGGANPL